MPDHRPLAHRFAADGAALPLARILVRHWLAEGGVDPPAADEVLFVANELCTHGVGVHPGGWCQLDVREEGSHVHLSVTGRPAPGAAAQAAGHLVPGSLALGILRRVCVSLEIDQEAGSVAVTCPIPVASSGVPLS